MSQPSSVRPSYPPTSEPTMLELNTGSDFYAGGGNLFHVRAPSAFSAVCVDQSARVLPATSALSSVKLFSAASDCGDLLTRHRHGICVGHHQVASNHDACSRDTCGERHLYTNILPTITSFLSSAFTTVKHTRSGCAITTSVLTSESPLNFTGGWKLFLNVSLELKLVDGDSSIHPSVTENLHDAEVSALFSAPPRPSDRHALLLCQHITTRHQQNSLFRPRSHQGHEV